MSSLSITSNGGGNGVDEHVLELLADRSLGQIEDAERAELDRLLAEYPGVNESCMDEAVAQAALLTPSAGPMPSALRQRIVDEINASSDTSNNAPLTLASGDVASEVEAKLSGNSGVLGVLGWLAAAACLAVAFIIASVNRPAEVFSPAERLAAMQSEEVDIVEIAWSPGPQAPGEVSGRVFWSPSRQEGYMTFEGLPANDPDEQQYQLWIFDSERPEATPVDGGVFDILASEGEQVVPINAKLKVFDPTLFAITVEQPGGVVVSERESIPIVAPVAGG